MSDATKDDPRIGTTVGGRYRLLEVLGTGGMGTVYRSVQPHVERPVAIKVLHAPDLMGDTTPARFLREARAVASIHHPSVVTLYDFGLDPDGTAFMVMEQVRGETLASQFEQGRIPPGLLLDLVLEVLGALEAAHAHGVVHRDLKPDNVMLLDEPTAHARVKVLDFGLAKMVRDDLSQRALTADGMVCGTPAYISPEQVEGREADARSDVYAVGVLLFEGLTGRRPFVGELAVDVLQAHLSAPVPRLSDECPPEVQVLVDRALAKDPASRYSGAAAMASAVTAAIAVLPEAFSAGDTLQTPIPPAVARMMLRLQDGAGDERAATTHDPFLESRHDTDPTPPPDVDAELDRMPTRPRGDLGFAPTMAPSLPWLEPAPSPDPDDLSPDATLLDGGAYAPTMLAMTGRLPTPRPAASAAEAATRPAVRELSAEELAALPRSERQPLWVLVLVFVLAAALAATVAFVIDLLRG